MSVIEREGKTETEGTFSADRREGAALLRTPDEIESLVCLFEEVAMQEGWLPGDALRRYRDQSIYFGLHDPAKGFGLIGGIQLILPGADSRIPSQSVWPELQFAADGPGRSHGVAHIAVMAVAQNWRGAFGSDGGGLFWNLAVAMWRHCVLNGIGELFLEATPRTLRCYRRMGWPLVIRGDLRMHWGELCYLTSMTVREVGGALTERAVRSPQYRSIVMRALQPPEFS